MNLNKSYPYKTLESIENRSTGLNPGLYSEVFLQITD